MDERRSGTTEMDEVELSLQLQPHRRWFTVDATPGTGAAANPVRLYFAFQHLEVRGQNLRIDEEELARLGWTEGTQHDSGDPSRHGLVYLFLRREPLPDDARALAAEARAVARSVLGVDHVVVRLPPPPSGAAVRAAGRRDAEEAVALAFGMLFILMPVSAVLSAVVGVATALVRPLEALVAVALTMLVVVAIVRADSGSRLGKVVYRLVVGVPATVVGWLALVPVLGGLATLLGSTLVLWYPIAILALVAIVL